MKKVSEKETYCLLFLSKETELREKYGENAFYSRPKLFTKNSKITTISSWGNFVGWPVIFPNPDFIDMFMATGTDMFTAKDNKPTRIDDYKRNLTDVLLALHKMDEIKLYKCDEINGTPLTHFIAYVGFEQKICDQVEQVVKGLPEVNV